MPNVSSESDGSQRPDRGIFLTLDFGVVTLGFSYQQGSGLSVERIGRVRVAEELWEEDLENVDHIKHR